jgi:hypothetical protein
MKPEELSTQTTSFDTALDAALARALPPPVPTAEFRVRLRAALARAGDHESMESRRGRLERERREGLAELENGYLQMRRRTLGTLIGGAFAAGAGVALLFPWLKATLGEHSMLALAGLGGVVGLVIGVSACLGRSGLDDPIGRL